ncbi:N-6 DNA methylase [Streptomyces sp. NPDC048481]|uniref:N-6 DNA methylase n=1 Tax=Streptomyces sp. NPDC048481 TaxID=3365557 RepID=UPI00371ECF76
MSAHEAVPVSLAEIARIAGVGRAAVSNWRRRHDSFPARIGGTDVSPQFSLPEVEQWLRDNGRNRDVGGRELLWPRFEALGGRTESGLAVAAAGRRMRFPRTRTMPPELSARARDVVADAAKVGRREGPRETFEFLLRRWLETHVRQLGTTPPQLAALMARIALAVRLGPATDGLTLLDPACGTGHLAAAVVREYGGSGLEVLACEKDLAPAALTAGRLEFLAEDRDIRTQIVCADSLRDDPFAGTKADIALCHPPFNGRDWGYAELAADRRWTHGLPPRTEPELAWVQHVLAHLKPGGAAVVVLPPAVAARKAGRRVRGSLLRTGALRAVVSLPPGSAQPHSVSLQLWILRATPDGPAAAPPSQEALLVDATRFASEGAREPSPDWDGLGSFLLAALATLDRPDREPPQGAARVPLLDLLDDEVDVTPGRYTAAAAGPSREELTVGWNEFETLLTDLAEHTRLLSALASEAGDARTATTVGDLVTAGALTLRTGRQPSEPTAPAGGAAVPLLTVADLLNDGAPGATVPIGSAQTVAEEGDVVVAGVARAFRAWVHEGPPVALGPQLHVLRVDAGKLEPHFLAGCLSAPANGRQAGTHASSSSRVDIRRLQVLRLPLEQQSAHAETFRRLRAFEALLTAAGTAGEGLAKDMRDRLATGGPTT